LRFASPYEHRQPAISVFRMHKLICSFRHSCQVWSFRAVCQHCKKVWCLPSRSV